jgi:hypothetical protein
MQAKVEIIDVAYAKQLLEQNPHNRPISAATVRRYASDMKAGRWNNNGQGIVLTPEGKLLDGQHRMAAIVEAQTPIGMLVVRGVPQDTFVTMDSGKPRSMGDVLAIEGYVHTNTLAGIARASYGYVAGASVRYPATKATLEAFIRAHPYMQDVARYIGNRPMKLPRSPLGAVLFLGNERRSLDGEVADFVDGLITGEGLFKGDARLTLREWFAAQRMKERGRLTSETMFAAFARAWNAFASGKELAVLKGLDSPTRRTLPVFGFDIANFPEVPDLAERSLAVARTNLSKAHATRPLRELVAA